MVKCSTMCSMQLDFMVRYVKISSSEIQVKESLIDQISFSCSGKIQRIINFVFNERQENGVDEILY